MQFSLPQILIFSQTGLHSQRQPGTSLLHQLVIDKVEPVKKINKKIGSFRIKNNVTEYLPGHYINIFSGKSDSLLHTTFIKKICQKTYLINYINLHSFFLIYMHTFWYQKRVTCSKAVVDSKLLVHIQEHCHTVQTKVLPPIYNSWGQQTAL